MRNESNAGCGLMLVVSGVSSLLLVVNSALITWFLSALRDVLPILTAQPRLQQAITLLGAVALIVAQWWLVDLIRDHTTGMTERGGQPQARGR